MTYKDITLVLGVDSRHAKELTRVWPTWMLFKPELKLMPCIIFYDVTQVNEMELEFVRDHPNIKILAWDLKVARTQREKMLTGFIHVAAKEVVTPWYLKIDTDVVATSRCSWIDWSWFDADADGCLPAFVSQPWGYTKPRYLMDQLDDWGDGMAVLAAHPRLNLQYSSASSKVHHNRIISWLFFGQTEWTREMFSLIPADGRLPVPSQDSFLFYCAARSRHHYVRANMRKLGWAHTRIRLNRPMRDEHAVCKPLDASPSRGVVYYNRGTSCLVRLVVSLYSLRRFYDGPVTILSEGPECFTLCREIGAAFEVEVKDWNSGIPPGPNAPFLAKTRLNIGSPYFITVALDSDTLVTGAIDELFSLAERHTFCVAQLGSWITSGRTIQKRLQSWAHIPRQDIDQAVQFGPAVNTGVTAFTKDATIFGEWYEIALSGREYFIPDEVSCQIILPRHRHHILDGRWNRSCRHDDPTLPDTRVIHYHGRKHCRLGLPFYAARWIEAYQAVWQLDIAQIQRWSPAGDRHLSRYIKSLDTKGHSARSSTSAPSTNLRNRIPVYQTSLWCRRGHLNQDQADKYDEICGQVKPHYVLEVGFCTGRATTTVLYGSPQVVSMVTIDIDLEYCAPAGKQMVRLIEESFKNWKIIEQSTRDVLNVDFFHREFPHGVDLALVDGDHSYEGCSFDLDSVAPYINLNGVIVVDDYRSGPPKGVRIDSVTASVDDFLARNNVRFRGERWHKEGKGLCVIERIS